MGKKRIGFWGKALGKIPGFVKKFWERGGEMETKKEGVSTLVGNALSKLGKNTPMLCISQSGFFSARNVSLLSMLLLSLLVFAGFAAAIPEVFTVQGRLADSSGNALTGTYEINFVLYDSNTAAKNILWSESRNVSVSNGIFNVVIGDANTQTQLNSLDFNSDLWLGLFVEGEAQTPLIRFSSIGSSFVSKKTMGIDLNAFMGFSDFNSWYHSVFDLNQHYYQKYDVNTHFVPYIGATADLNAGAHSVKAFGDSNFHVLHVDALFGDGSALTGISADVNGTNIAPANVFATGDLNAEGDVNGSVIMGRKYKSRDANSAFGTNAVALGYKTTAFGNYSTAVGYNTTASGGKSTAMGRDTTASGVESTAMGLGTTASGTLGNTAMGYNTTASGTSSTAMGGSTIASGDKSTAMGENTTASGGTSTAMGGYTIASGDESTAMGKYNVLAFGTGSIAMGYGDASGPSPQGVGIFAKGRGSIAGGYTTTDANLNAEGDGAIALGYSDTNMIAGDEASDKGAVALGYNVQALAPAAVTLGGNIINSDANSVAVNDFNAAGDANFHGNVAVDGILFGDGSALTGISADVNGTDIAPANVFATGDLNAEGDVNGSVIMGRKYKSRDANSAFGANAVALGTGATAFGDYSVAAGYQPIADGFASVAMGYTSQASGEGSTALGRTTLASGNYSTALGYYTYASGDMSTALGYYTTASGGGSLAAGTISTPTDVLEASGIGSVAMGYSDDDLTAAGKGAIALGYNVQALGEASATIGKGIINSDPNSLAVNDLNAAGDANFHGNVAVDGILFGDGSGLSNVGGGLTESDANGMYVPYIGADTDVNIGSYSLSAFGDVNFHNIGISGTLYGGSPLSIGSDVNISRGVNKGVSIQSDANRMCFPSNSCEAYIDYNGTALVLFAG